jgi:hypothetical protein
MQNYLPINITDYENSTSLIYFTGQKGAQFQRYVCVYKDMGRAPPPGIDKKEDKM